MRAVIQRVRQAEVQVDGVRRGAIGPGLLVRLRIFADEQAAMNRSVCEVDGEILAVSQFTLAGDCRKGNRPSFARAARPEVAAPLFADWLARLAVELGKPVPTGVFGADMQVSLVNDGPVTLWLESRPAV